MSIPRFKVKPTRENVKVPFPMSRKFLSHNGEMVDKTRYWIKRIQEGDVEEIKDAPKPKKVIKADASKQNKKVKKKNKSTKMEVES